MNKDIYSPAEDSFFLKDCINDNLNKSQKNIKILEIGCGSGFQLQNLKEKGFENIQGVDINKNAVNYCKKQGFDCIESNLFSRVKNKFDIIIFNPPYLPKDDNEPQDSQLATTGGEKGCEIINEFLKQAKNYLKENGEIFLLTSNLTKDINWEDWKKNEIGRMKLFFEELYVWKVWK